MEKTKTPEKVRNWEEFMKGSNEIEPGDLIRYKGDTSYRYVVVSKIKNGYLSTKRVYGRFENTPEAAINNYNVNASSGMELNSTIYPLELVKKQVI